MKKQIKNYNQRGGLHQIVEHSIMINIHKFMSIIDNRGIFSINEGIKRGLLIV